MRIYGVVGIMIKNLSVENIGLRVLMFILIGLFLVLVFPITVFSAPAPPTTETNLPTNITDNSATLTGLAVPNEDSTDVWFQWGTNPANLSNTTLVQNLGSGTSSIDFSAELAGLADNTVYHFRAAAMNSNGTDFGIIRSFTTENSGTGGGSEPDVFTISAIDIDSDEARLRGEVDTNTLNTEVWFEWGKSSVNLNRDTSREEIGGGTFEADFDKRITGLDDNTRYYFRAVAENDEGIDRGLVHTFITDRRGSSSDDEPDIRDVDVDNIDDDRARLICEVDANGNDTDVWFEWDEDEDDVDDGRGEDTRRIRVDESERREEVRITITGLDEDTRYFFRCLARNREGTVESRVEDFRTDDRGSRSDDEPEVTTRAVTDITNTSVLLRGEVDPNGEDTDAWFEWSTNRLNLNNDTRVEDVGDGTREVDFDRRVRGLRSGTTYYFRAVAENRDGIDRGSILNFKTKGSSAGFTTVPAPTPSGSVTPVARVPLQPQTVFDNIVDIFRNRLNRDEGLIITLEVDVRSIGNDEIEYKISYDNQSDDTFTNTVLVVVLPDDLRFVDSKPGEDDKNGGEITFEIGTIDPGDEGEFVIETELRGGIGSGEDIVFSVSIVYVDDDIQKIITVVEATRIEAAQSSGFVALFVVGLASFLTSPFLWLVIMLVVIFFVYRYFAGLAKPQDEEVILSEPIGQQQLPGSDGGEIARTGNIDPFELA